MAAILAWAVLPEDATMHYNAGIWKYGRFSGVCLAEKGVAFGELETASTRSRLPAPMAALNLAICSQPACHHPYDDRR